MGLRFLKIAVVYLAVGSVLGLVMGIAQNFAFVAVHAHLLLLGWASLALAGIIYHLYPAAAETRLARLHFWLHNIGLPGFMIGLTVILAGHPGAIAATATFATLAIVGLLLFAWNVLANAKDPAIRA